MVSEQEILSGQASAARTRRTDAHPAAAVEGTFKTGGRFDREVANGPAFAVGQAVRARTINPVGHTRLPRYARGKLGIVHRRHGAHVLPDTNAMGEGEHPEHLYSVMFTARELWGETAVKDDKVYLDLWESYLDAA
jgi:nitrile hydratase